MNYFEHELKHQMLAKLKSELPLHWKPLRGLSRSILSEYAGQVITAAQVARDQGVKLPTAGQSLVRLSRRGYVKHDKPFWRVS